MTKKKEAGTKAIQAKDDAHVSPRLILYRLKRHATERRRR